MLHDIFLTFPRQVMAARHPRDITSRNLALHRERCPNELDFALNLIFRQLLKTLLCNGSLGRNETSFFRLSSYGKR